MFDHPIIDVARGLILLYSTRSLVGSVVTFPRSARGGPKNLRKGIENLIGEEPRRTSATDIPWSGRRRRELPSYVGSDTFAAVLLDPLGQDENGKSTVTDGDKAATIVDRVREDALLGPALRAMSAAGAETVADLGREIAA